MVVRFFPRAATQFARARACSTVIGVSTRTASPQVACLNDLGNHGAVLTHRHDEVLRRSSTTAASGNRRTGEGGATVTRSLANWPGARNRSGLGTVARAWIVPLDRSRELSTKSSVPCRAKVFSSLSPIMTLSASGHTKTRALPREVQIVGLAHIKIEVDRIERYQRSQQGGRTDGGATAGN
jgi:hypothetical protein